MERKQISITVAGTAATGKSRIMYLIKEMLKQEGFNVDYIPNRDHPTEFKFNQVMINNLDVALERIKEKTNIAIKEKQIIKQ